METLTIDLKKKKSFEIGQQGDHNALCIHFINMKNVGTNKKYIYYTIDGIENCVPLTNDRFIIGYPLTAHSGIASAQLISKLNDNSIIKLSNVFAMHIKESKGYKDSGEYPVDPNIQSSYDLLDDLINETKDLINNYNYATLMEKLTQASSEATTSATIAKKCADELKSSTDFINTLDDKVAAQDSKIEKIEASTSHITTKQNTKIAALHTRMSEFTSLKDGSTTGDAELIDARIGADGTKYPSAGDAMRGQVEQLKEDLSDWYRLEGLERGNLVPELTLEQKDKYAYATSEQLGKKPIFGVYEGCSVYILDIDKSNYVFSDEIRTIVLADSNGNCLSETINNASSIDNTSINAKKMYLSIVNPNVTLDTLIISKGDKLKTLDIFPEHTGIPQMQNSIQKLEDKINNYSINKLGVSISRDVFNQNDNIILGDARTNLRKGIRCVFECVINSGNSFEFGFSVSTTTLSYTHNRFVFNNNQIEYYEDYGDEQPTEIYTHNLTFNNIVQMIFEYTDKGTCSLTLICDGESFKIDRMFTITSVAVPYVKSIDLIGQYTKFNFTCDDLLKNIWIFGDSYISYSSTRWTYYLNEYGYDKNVLLDGFPGMDSLNARLSLETLLKFNKPNVLVWAEGMNDGSDVDLSTPSEDWTSERDKVINLCNENNIQLIFATIPNVPSVNNKGKNQWIRNSKYEYIDMAKAVGSDVYTNWYDGMLSADKVHPSEKGAKALFSQVLLDFPQIMVDNL